MTVINVLIIFSETCLNDLVERFMNGELDCQSECPVLCRYKRISSKLGGRADVKLYLSIRNHIFSYIYYIDTNVLLENIPLVKFIKLHPGREWFPSIILSLSFCIYNK